MKNIIEERQFAACEIVVCERVIATDTVAPLHTVQTPVKKAGLAGQVYAAIYSWNERRVSRKILHSLSTDQLKDIGLAKSDIDREYPRSVWPNWPK
ncbi:DUF1127 domain-containing protein [Rahnella inusitata]|uniref:DUF1127 domain-containing protein n=1 Tax=Rahnella inusitata TaxID=58169 RepID=A0ABX9P409_9GAMM|nr:DUF1127 domain-containing protein [Rahnella inusitata]QUT14021.1 DUF1127 domain-containing protein [Rahnella inusitata]RJT14905.1 DUF1127 domain-containing protein [Rahnella inusitata]